MGWAHSGYEECVMVLMGTVLGVRRSSVSAQNEEFIGIGV
jgi:hypothetical protein